MRLALASLLLVCGGFVACGGAGEDHQVGGTPGDVSESSPGATMTSAPAAPAPPSKPPCPADVDSLLREVGAVVAEDRLDCGLGRSGPGLQEFYDCFATAPLDPGAQFTINDCTDCSIPTTYVSTPTPAYFAILLEDDQYGDAFREARVTRCSDIQFSGISVDCRNGEQLFSCKEFRH
jgi:hypothetical protein